MYKRIENKSGVKLWGNRQDQKCPTCNQPPDKERWIWDWHQGNLPKNRYASNLDMIKYRIDNGVVRPVALLEYSSMYPDTSVDPEFLEKKRDQSIFKLMDCLARTLKVEAYYVLHTDDKSLLYIFSIHEKGWPCKQYSTDQFYELLHGLIIPRPHVWDWVDYEVD